MALDEQKQRETLELRKKRRKKEQMQAFALLGGAFVAVVIFIVIIVCGVNALIGSDSKDKKARTPDKKIEEKKEPAQDTEDEISKNSTDTETTANAESVDETDNASQNTESTTEVVTDDMLSEETEQEVEGENVELTEEQEAAQLDAYVQEMLSKLSMKEKIGQMFLVTPYNITGVANAKQAGSSTSTALADYSVGGILYDETNMEDKEQLSTMIKNTKSFANVEMFFAVSDEGGEDSPFSVSGIRETAILSQSEMAVGGISEAYSAGISKSSEFRNVGINLNLAPLTDVTLNANSTIANRTYGKTASGVLSLAKSEVKGMTDQSVNCCVKYFPSHGDITGDTKTSRVTSQRTKEELDKTEGLIYKELISEGVPMIMVSHVTMPKVTGDNMPASLSSVMVTDILRNELGFEGVIVTDYMNKAAITRFFKHADASVMAVQAGVDMIAVPGDFKKSYNGLLEAVEKGEISEERINESVTRILKMKYRNLVNY